MDLHQPPKNFRLTASTSRTDQESTSDPADLPSTSAPYLIPIPERKRRRRLVKTAEMVRPRPVVQDLLADLPTDAEAAPTQSMIPPKSKRVKKAQPKAKATDAEAEDALPISKLAESKKSASTSTKRSAEGQPSGSTQTKRPRSSSATTSASKKPDVPWAPDLSLEDRPIMASESADDINVAVALSTALLLPNDLERNSKLSEYENYALMLQHSAQAIQHAHSFAMQSFENRQRLVDMKREASSMKREIKSLEAKMKKLEDQAEATTKVQTLALEKAEAAEAVRKVAEAEKREAEVQKAQAKKELQQALATKEAEIKEADEKLDLPTDSPLRQADAIPLPFPPPPPEGGSESEAEAVDEDEERRPKNAAEAKSPPPAEQVMDLTLDEEGDGAEGAPKETATGQLSSNLLLVERSVESTVAEIDAEIEVEKVAEEVPPESFEVPVPAVADAEES
ncbi:actin cytoskeleton-regulatory complex protein PAN1-like [Camellia sinensis]|uniref:actin cytoskeleton-regulatory complex protein PAN1-like n=1 Tax=Camellia sinensis TaxID=4442 RepID=UPI001035BA9C|nr:actin cytoskeleton-regulatory complex protein PAN1-like [Camellia sinensis]